MNDQDWEALFDRYITEVVDDEQEHIKSHELPTAIKIRGLVSNSGTQAAANKAAEEGGLPELPNAYQEAGEDAGCWFPDFFTESQMKSYARGAIAADRASRQVANKAEVDAKIMPEKMSSEMFRAWESISNQLSINDMEKIYAEMYEVVPPGNKAEVEPFLYTRPFDVENAGLSRFVLVARKPSDEFDIPLYAIPPATTGGASATPTGASTAARFGNVWNDALEEAALICEGVNNCTNPMTANDCADEIRALKGSVGASTVLTDERVETEFAHFCDREGYPSDSFRDDDLRSAFRAGAAIEREVAAQAGQVAVPEGWTVEQVGDAVNIKRADGQWCGYMQEIDSPAHRLTYEFLSAMIAAPSPAKESK